MNLYWYKWLTDWINEWMHKGEETNPPSRKIPNSLSKPKCLHYFYLTINKILHTLHYGTYVNQTGIQYQITFNNLGAQLYQVGRQALVIHRRNARTPSSCFYRKKLETGKSERSEGKARRPGSSPGTSEPWLTGLLGEGSMYHWWNRQGAPSLPWKTQAVCTCSSGEAPLISKSADSRSLVHCLSFTAQNLPQIGITNQKSTAESCTKAKTKRC